MDIVYRYETNASSIMSQEHRGREGILLCVQRALPTHSFTFLSVASDCGFRRTSSSCTLVLYGVHNRAV